MGWFSKKNVLEIKQFRNRISIDGLSATIATDVGNVRTNNEDGALICFPEQESQLKKKGCLFILADGMGGHNCGEVASELAITVFANTYFNCQRNVLTSLQKALQKANEIVYNTSLIDPKYSGMGTTLTALLLKENDLYLVHVGDSRAYLLKKDTLVRMSKDQTLVQQLLDLGELTEAEAALRPDRNVLVNALGTKPTLAGDVLKLGNVLKPDDTILICSDGLYDLLADEDIFEMVNGTDSLEEMGKILIVEAKQRGGHDNITVLLASRKEQPSMPELKHTQDYEIF